MPGPKNGDRRDQGGQDTLWQLLRHPCSTAPAEDHGADARGGRLRRRGQAAPRPRDRARRAERRPRRGPAAAKSRGLVSGGRSKPWRQKGTGRARQGTIRAPQFTGGGVAFPPNDAQLRRQGEPQGPPRRAARRALRARAGRDASASSTPARSTRRRRRQRSALVAAWGKDVAARARRRARTTRALIKCVPQPRARAVVTVPAELEVAARSSGRARCSSPRPRCRARAGEGCDEPASEPGPARSGRLGEELRADRASSKYSFKVHPDAHKTQVRQAVEELFDVKVMASTSSRCRRSRSGAASTRACSPAGRRRSSRSAEGDTIEIFEGARSRWRSAEYKPTSPGRRFMSVSAFEEVTKTEPEKSLLEPIEEEGRPEQRTAASRRATRAAATSAATA